MADANEKRRDIEAQIAKLSGDTARRYRELLNILVQNNAALSEFDELLIDVNNRTSAISDGFGSIESQLNGIVNELKNANSSSKDITRAFSNLRSVAQKLKYDQQGITDLNKDQLKQEKSKIKILQDQLKVLAEEAKKKEDAGERLTEQEASVIAAYKTQFSIIEDINAALDERIKQEDEINKRLGITGVLLTGMSKIPIVGPLLKTNEALEEAREKAKAGGNAFKVMGTGLASVGKSLLSSLGDPLVIIGLLVKGFQELLKLGFKFDKQVTSLQKTLYLSRVEAEGMHKTFGFMTRSQTQLVDGYNTALSTLQNQTDAANQLGTAFGAVTRVTNKEIQNQIKLTQQLGLSVEEANNLYVLARQNNITQDDITKEVTSQVNTFKKQSGTLLDSKKILQDVSKISGQIRLQYGNSYKQLVAATIQANKLGFSLEQTKKIAEGLLNFEESIENELSAELLIGRDLNLEQARLLALNGKSAEATALIAENMGGSAGFASMNVIQQEALAKALGMNADELANSIMHQENLAKLSVDDKKRLEDKLAYYRSIGDIEKAQQLERAAADGTNLDAALAAIDAEKTFQATVESIKDSIGSIASGPAMKLANALSDMLISGTGLYKVLGGVALILGTMSVAKLVTGLVSAAVAAGTMAVGAAATASALTLGIAAVAIAGGIALIMNGIDSAAANAEKIATKPAKANYASGGIVGGNSLAGDNVKINANSGEMVLNRAQQSKLFNMINNGGGGGGPIQVTVYGQIDKKTLFTFMAEGEKTNSNDLGRERQISNRSAQ